MEKEEEYTEFNEMNEIYLNKIIIKLHNNVIYLLLRGNICF